MKKVSILFAALMIAVVGFAQSEGKFAVEINLNNPFVNADFFSTNGISARYFLSDNMVVRGTLNVGTSSDTDKIYNTEDKLFSTTKLSASSFGITPGIEFHIAKFTKGSVYAGGELGISFVNTKSSTVFGESNFGEDFSSKRGGFGFGLGVFTGVDYYVTSNIYLGAELGLNYNRNSISRGSTTTGSTTTDGTTSGSVSGLGIDVNPALRLGWRF